MVVGLLLGMPIAFAMAGAGILGIWLVTGDWQAVMGIVGTSVYRGAADYILTTVPMFILLAYFTSASGMARNLYQAAASWVSHIPGGLAIGTIIAGAVFGALSGASTAAASVLSEVALPNMREHKYSDVLSTGAICLGATIDLLIPPSVAMVIYGLVTETSINKLLIAGIMPGLILAAVTVVIILVWVRINPSIAPGRYRSTWADRRKSLRETWPSATLIVLMLGMLYSGAVTASEVAAIGALAAALIALGLRRLTWNAGVSALRSTVRTTTMIFSILIGATIFGYYVTLTRVPQALVAYVSGLNLNPYVVVIFIIVAYFVVSMFMDELPLMILTLPFTFPLIVALGFDPIWFGVMNIMMVIMGLIFPPVGMVAFVVSAMTRVELVTVFRGASVLLVGVFITTALVLIFPALATWLPSLIG
jgi:tripartite ATP-independent transporter DctM subunit